MNASTLVQKLWSDDKCRLASADFLISRIAKVSNNPLLCILFLRIFAICE